MIEITYDKVVHSSDHFDKIQEHTERLIRQGDAFMDDTDGETVSCWIFLVSALWKRVDMLTVPGQRAETSRDPLKEPRCFS